MSTEIVNRCPKCQAPVPPEAPEGLCPKCLMTSAVAPTDVGQSAAQRPVPPIETVAGAFPQLEIIEFVGQGGMGLVYKARQPKLDRLVALKLLPRTAGADPSFGERFNREARVLARLSHPNIVAVHDFGQAGDFYYLVMEYVDGVNLRQAMRAGRFTQAQALSVVPKICDALQYAHEEGVLHRDIKPENLLLDARGRIKVADFGIAKLQGEGGSITLTASGAVVGTPHYMAPEQLERPQDVDQRADIYSLGVVFYEMLTGELPLGRFAPPSAKGQVDERLDEVVLRTLEKERERRFQTAGEVKTRVETIASTPPQGGQAGTADSNPPPESPAGRRWSRLALGAAALTGLGLASLFLNLGRGRFFGSPGLAPLGLLVGGPALGSILLGRAALQLMRAAPGQWRGRGLALFAIGAWLLAAINLVVAGVFELAIDILSFSLTPALALMRVLVLLGLNGIVLWHWLMRWPKEDRLLPTTEVVGWVKRTPRRFLWAAGPAMLVLCVIATLPWRRSPPVTAVEPSAIAPGALAGYETPSGVAPSPGQDYQAPLRVPAGYALTLAMTVCSNQVVVRSGEPNVAAYVIAPPGQEIQANFKWRLLANTTLADGAPLECSLIVNGEGNRSPLRAVFHLTPPVPVLVDWCGQPNELWPPHDGLTRFLLLKGMTQGEEPAAEWAVGIQLRLDPLPASSLPLLSQPKVGTGTNWLQALDAKPLTQHAESPDLEAPQSDPSRGAP